MYGWRTLVLASALVVLALLLFFRFQRRPWSESYQPASGEPVAIRISRTEIGVLPQAGVARADAFGALERLGLRRSDTVGEILLADLPEARSREGIMDLIYEIQQQESQFIALAGMVVRREGEDTPILATNEIVVRLRQGRTPEELTAQNKRLQVDVAMANPFDPYQYLLRLLPGSGLDPFSGSRAYAESGLTEFAFPNFVSPSTSQQEGGLFSSQWPHRNTGQSNGTVDADGDTVEAWNITRGSPSVVIAIVELGGFDPSHPDLSNLWANPGEIPDNGRDDDRNGFTDDVHGWNFNPCVNPVQGCGNANLEDGDNGHATAVAGIAAARGIEVTGVCPSCQLMLIRAGQTDWGQSLAIRYAYSMGADVINNSWETLLAPATAVAIADAATSGRGNLGAVVVVGAGNAQVSLCGAMELVKSPYTIGVGSASNQDRKVILSATGPCVDILAPSHRGYDRRDPFKGTLNIATTDSRGVVGINNVSPVQGTCPSNDFADKAYTRCFGGTSAAAPFVAGVAGLLLSVQPNLTREQVHRLLQDTADRIEPSEGDYSEVNGRSSSTDESHAYGRVNAFEAVRVAAGRPVGKGGVDLFLRDNNLDWGNTEQKSSTRFDPVRGTIPIDVSPDIRGLLTASAATFESLAVPSLRRNAVNTVKVRVRNRGPVTAPDARVDLYMTAVSSSVPSLPSNFWTPGFTATSPWKIVGSQNVGAVPYSGSSVAGNPADPAKVVTFSVTPPADASKVMLLAIVDSSLDRVGPRARTPSAKDFIPSEIIATDNNVAARTVVVTK